MTAKISRFFYDHPFWCVGILSIVVLVIWKAITLGADTSNKIAGIFTPIIAGIITFVLARKQHSISDAQREVSSQQAKIAKNKLILDLFDKRYEIYETIISVKLAVNDLSCCIDDRLRHKDVIEIILKYIKDKTDREVENKKLHAQNKMSELKLSLGKIEFLFNEQSYYLCIEIINNVNSYLESVKFRYEDDCISYYKNDYPVGCFLPQISQRYCELLEILKPYMDLSTIQ